MSLRQHDHPAADAARNRELATAIKAGDPTARSTMILENLALVRSEMAAWNSRRPLNMTSDDVMGEAIVILIRAVDLYNPSRASFASYAVITLRHEMQKAMARYKYDGAVTHSVDRTARNYACMHEAAKEFHRNPTAQQVADMFGIDPTRAERLHRIHTMQPALSTEEIAARCLNESTDRRSSSEAPAPDNTEEDAEMAINVTTITKAMHKLSPLQKQIIEARFIERRTLQSVGKELDMSRIDVRKVEREALASMREAA